MAKNRYKSNHESFVKSFVRINLAYSVPRLLQAIGSTDISLKTRGFIKTVISVFSFERALILCIYFQTFPSEVIMPTTPASYPSDLSEAQWQFIALLIPVPQSSGRPREYGVREIVNAIFYVLRSGCSWRMLPHDFPP
jgi:hypothetical protein